MIYSCFQQTPGLYAYFEGPGDVPLNGDLPVPRLPAAVGGIGVPSIEAGRPLPAGAKYIGSGWHARGMLVKCGPGGSLGAMPSAKNLAIGVVLLGGLAAGAYYFARRQKRSQAA